MSKPKLSLSQQGKTAIKLSPPEQHQSDSVVLNNDYPLEQDTSVKAPKRSIKASYSENGILNDIGVEKRRVYQYQNADGITVFSDKSPQHNDYQVLLYECFACRPESTIDWYKIPLNTADYKHFVNNAARQHKLDAALIRAVIHAESAFKEKAVSRVGAKGLMQLMPVTAKEMGVLDSLNAADNINGGSRYLAKLLKQFKGDLELACAAYNAGPSNVLKHNGVPPFPETQAYVKRVQILYKRYQKAHRAS
ncbi:lytic transglycosylase domain-containing protein [Shewanella sp. WXL01]|nr:lytic transglycosylase domain-containing protein [Shewanella sp. WXL01]